MRNLHFSDLHLDAVTAGMRRIDDLAGALDRLFDLVVTRDVDNVIFQGDLADPDCGSILVRVLDVFLGFAADVTLAGRAFYAVAGNHDTIEDGSGLTTLHPLRHVPGVEVFEGPRTVVLGSRSGIAGQALRTSFLPFPTRATQYDPAEYLRQHHGSGGMVVGHCTGLDGVEVGSETYDMARGAELPFPLDECRRLGVELMFNGHFHKQQRTKGGVWIPGSLERLRFDEQDNVPGVMIVEVPCVVQERVAKQKLSKSQLKRAVSSR